MKFNELAWSAVCFYYRSNGDRRYCTIMKNTDFLARLRNQPETLSVKEFGENAILDYINLEHYDLLVSHRLAEKVLVKIIEMKPEIELLSGLSLRACDLKDSQITEAMINIYSGLRAYGLWVTGASKIAHLVNDQLFPLLSPSLVKYYGIYDDLASIKHWLASVQGDIQEAVDDFNRHGLQGTPNEFLSNHIGYTKTGCNKSLVKLADEYYWLKYADALPVPPVWVPPLVKTT
jgi:hypothetical protein